MTWLPGPVAGMFFCLYRIVAIFSRKIVGWVVQEREAAELAATLIRPAALSEGFVTPSASSRRTRVMRALIARRLPAAPFSMQRLGHKTRDDGQAKPQLATRRARLAEPGRRIQRSRNQKRRMKSADNLFDKHRDRGKVELTLAPKPAKRTREKKIFGR